MIMPVIEATLEQLRTDDDWYEVFGTAMGAEPPADKYISHWEHKDPQHVGGFKGSSARFTRADIAEVIASANGMNDESDWIGVFRLQDGRFAAVRAGCDYTGWGCQQWGHADVGGDLESIVRFGLTAEERERLGLSLDDPRV